MNLQGQTLQSVGIIAIIFIMWKFYSPSPGKHDCQQTVDVERETWNT